MKKKCAGECVCVVGFARKGFKYEIVVDGPYDADLRRKIAMLTAYRIRHDNIISSRLKRLQLGGRLVPFFSLRNYTPREQEAMRRLHPQPGGTLRESVHEVDYGVSGTVARIGIVWETGYLGYLVAHGVSRHPGTTTMFYQRIQERGQIAPHILNIARRIARENGVNPRHVHVRFGGLIEA